MKGRKQNEIQENLCGVVGCCDGNVNAACGGNSSETSTDADAAGSGDAKRVCFVARASADTFAAWMTEEMKKAAEGYDDIEMTCVSGEGDDNTENGLLEDCITKQYDLVLSLIHI